MTTPINDYSSALVTIKLRIIKIENALRDERWQQAAELIDQQLAELGQITQWLERKMASELFNIRSK